MRNSASQVRLPIAMKTTSSTRTIGIDLGDRKHAICVLDKAGEVLSETSIPNDRGELAKLPKRYPKALIAME